MKQKLEELFKEHEIIGIAFDSRKVEPGYAYFAIKGTEADGNEFIDNARAAGAKLIITGDATIDGDDVAHTLDIRLTLALAAGIIFPGLPEKIIAVTGTNGKSSVVSYCRQILEHLGVSVLGFGTVGLEGKADVLKHFKGFDSGGLTSFDPITFRQILHKAAESDVKVVAFEASSHGLDQSRLGDVPVDSAAFVSFSQDHLDYHETMEDYLAAKLKLFDMNLRPGKRAVIASDIAEKATILEHLKDPIECGREAEVDLLECHSTISGQEIEFKRDNHKYKFMSEIIGSYQATNLLIAAELVMNLGLPDIEYNDIAATLGELKAVRGRMERVTKAGHDFHVFVDYSHTPDALEKSLIELRALLPDGGRLVVVFGAGGERDTAKRPKMGDVAERLADLVVVTDDNPRGEDPGTIRAEVIGEHSDFIEIGDRGEAIKTAVEKLQKNDIMLIAGKGHEDYQIIGDEKVPFCDLSIAKGFLLDLS